MITSRSCRNPKIAMTAMARAKISSLTYEGDSKDMAINVHVDV
ncbi:MAG: hypothetical protein AB1468_06870 [Candidatus Micrarchaeota archaeon]